MPVFNDAPVRVQPYFGYRNQQRLVISARALRSGKANFSRGGRWQAMRTMLSQFASREVEGLSVTLEFQDSAGQKTHHPAETDREGFVHFDVPLSETALPNDPMWDVVALRWSNSEGDQCVEGHVLAPSGRAKLGVISDIDDTIIETGITGSFRAIIRNWRRVLAEMPEERLNVPGVDAFYSSLGGGSVLQNSDRMGKAVPTLSKRPFFYVSSSPWNLFSYLVAFKKTRDLPLGPIMLRDWGFNRETLGSSSHGAHKRDAIDTILRTYPDMRFALIGDDSQGDLTAYGDIVADHPGRIAAVFIRTVGAAFSPEEIAAKAVIEANAVPLWLGGDYKTGEAFLKATGLASDKEATQIVTTIDKAHPNDQEAVS
ncbi:phosphatase domain-containing protein [Pontixanthobacter sp. CEM42]|uniref:App1 family protein n=1 Tax=Pontixanthobacter sp. CEM42 TaxID=2792077 RepID=UPI001ADF0AEA|nr:phosphatase domain-containing protein [Pontixanthobacter sp. CEM42]